MDVSQFLDGVARQIVGSFSGTRNKTRKCPLGGDGDLCLILVCMSQYMSLPQNSVMLKGREPLFNEFSGCIFLWLLFLDNSDSLTSPLGHFCCACKKSKSCALINSEPLLSLSEPINTCCHTVIAPPKLFSTQYKWRVVKTLLRKSLVRPVANIRA